MQLNQSQDQNLNPGLMVKRILRYAALSILLVLLLASSALPPGDRTESVRFFTRAIEFDFISWSLNAIGVKFNQSALGINRYLTDEDASGIVIDFIEMTRAIQIAEGRLREIYTNPEIEDLEGAARELNEELTALYQQRGRLGPLAESIVQSQVLAIVHDFGLSLGGQSIPPILYHMTPAPSALIVSPRELIRQDNNISIRPDVNLEDQIALEDAVAESLDVSTLVVGIGGIGLYPTMVTQTSNLNFLAEVVAHEWIHNFLTLRPLGVAYLTSPALRTMNETAARIAGIEIGTRMIERYYPEFAPPPPQPAPEPTPSTPEEPPPEPVFDRQVELRETRIRADELLQAGKIEEAEIYMELRRRFLWENGVRERKINQAFFSFYGSYADQPGGAAGDDPVGAAVRELRARSDSLAEFLNTISWMYQFDQLEGYLEIAVEEPRLNS